MLKCKLVFSAAPLFLIFLFVSFTPICSAEKTRILLSDGLTYDFVCHYAESLTDEKGQYTIADVSAPRFSGVWGKMNSSGFIPGKDKVVWLRFTGENGTDGQNEWILEYDYFKSVTELEFYIPQPDGSFLIKRASPGLPYPGDEIPYRNYLFKLSLAPGHAQTFYVRACVRSDFYLVLKIWNPGAFMAMIRTEQLIIGVFLGVMCIMAFYNFFLYFSFRDHSYIYYVLFILSLTVLQLNNHHVLPEFFPFLAECDAALTTLFKLLSFITFLIFSGAYLMVGKYFPRVSGIIRILVYAVVGTGFLVFFFPFLRILNNILLGLSGILVLILAVIILLKGNRISLFFLMAMSAIVLFGILVLIPEDWYYMKSLDFLSPYYMDFGSLLMVVFFSFGLAYRINILQKEKEHVERFKEVDRIKSRFFAHISHEFRTPLTLITGPLEDMLDTTTEPARKKKLELMLRNSDRLLGLINQLLELSRLENGRMVLEAEEQDIISFLGVIVKSLDYIAEQNQLRLMFQADEKEMPLFFDYEKMEKVFLNLLMNAIKFTPPGNRIIIEVTEKKPGAAGKGFPQGVVEIKITNTGVGIPGEDLAYIFEHFYQAGNLQPISGQGSGLGLALAKELVNLHHGTIDVESRCDEPDGKKYTTFIIRLHPGRKHLTDTEIALRQRENREKGSSAETRRISTCCEVEAETAAGREPGAAAGNKDILLIIEDDAELRAYIREGLNKEYEVREAESGEEGIAGARRIIPDLILCDIMMVGMDGFEVCRVLKKGVDTSHIPVILLTARASSENVLRGLECGANDYITKPFNLKMVAARIKNLIILRKRYQEKMQRELLLQPAEPVITSIDEVFIRKLHEAMDKYLADPGFSIEVLAGELFLSRTTLNRKIRALTGYSSNRYIQSYRLKTAARLLRSNAGNVTEVCYKVGFSSPAYFSKCFKKAFHQLPSHYQSPEEA